MRSYPVPMILFSSLAFGTPELPPMPLPTPSPLPSSKLPLKPHAPPPLASALPVGSPSFREPSVEAVSVLGLIDLFGSVERYRAAVSAMRMEVVTLKPKSRVALAPSEYAEGATLTLSGLEAEALRRALLDDSSYHWTAKETCECIPEYEFRVRFWLEKTAITIEVSLKQKTVRVVDEDREIASVPFAPKAKLFFQVLDRHLAAR